MSALMDKYSNETPENRHYFEKLLSHFSKFCEKEENQPSHFEQEFANFERKYFESLSPMIRSMMNMSFPSEQRMMKALWMVR